jgi:ubiquinone/menaquinone biosynthesis C-methylase UbiE
VTYAVAPEVAQVVACDLSGQMLSVVARAAADRGLTNVITQQAAAERLPFGDASFDFVLSRYSAHHWRDLDMGLREAARVLRPGGTASFVDVVFARSSCPRHVSSGCRGIA